MHRYTGARFNVSSERLLVILVGQPETRTQMLCSDPKHCVYESYALPTELYRLTYPKLWDDLHVLDIMDHDGCWKKKKLPEFGTNIYSIFAAFVLRQCHYVYNTVFWESIMVTKEKLSIKLNFWITNTCKCFDGTQICIYN